MSGPAQRTATFRSVPSGPARIAGKMNETILLVEDEEALRITLSERLRREGYVVEAARYGARALEQATTGAFDLIILDASYGIEACRVLRDAGLANPILVVTSQGQTAERVRALKLGADDCVPKPVEISEVVARIEALLRRRSLRTRRGVRHFDTICIDIPRGEVFREGKTRVSWSSGAPTFVLPRAIPRDSSRPPRTAARGVGVQSRNVLAHGGCARGQIAPEVGKESQTAETDPHGVRNWLSVWWVITFSTIAFRPKPCAMQLRLRGPRDN